MAAATLAGVAAAFVSLQGGLAASKPSDDATLVKTAGSGVTGNQMITTIHQDSAVLQTRALRRAAQRRHLAARRAQQQAAQRQAQPTPGVPVTAAVPTSSSWAPGRNTAARPARTATQAPLTEIRYSTTPSLQAARRTGHFMTGADDAPPSPSLVR